jgi:putative sigma-54 modulation protein
MQFSVTFRHMDPTDSLKHYARDRMERIRKYVPDPISCHVVMSTERHNHRIEVNFQLHNGLTIAGQETTENMYSSIDLCIAKIERQVRKYKGKIEEQKTRPHGVEPLPWSHSIVHEALLGIEDPAPEARPDDGGSPEFKVVRTEKLSANPMPVSAAIVQLNLLHEPFLVFRNLDDGGNVSVVYRRDDGNYGLIDTGANN